MKRLFPSILTVLLGLTLVIPISSSLAAGTLKVTTPNGGQKWQTGKKYAIKWVKGNAGGTVKIQLLKSGKHHKWIAKKTKNDGKYTWKIPTTVNSGSAYKVKIVSVKNKRVFDKSNKNFTITQTDSGGGTKSGAEQMAAPKIDTTREMNGSTDAKHLAKTEKLHAVATLGSNKKIISWGKKSAACTKITSIGLGQTIKDSWTRNDCSSSAHVLPPTGIWNYGYSKFYHFELSTQSKISFYLYTLPKLCKGPVPYRKLVIREGQRTSGRPLMMKQADCWMKGFSTTLTAGTYTIEAASRHWGNAKITGAFTLETGCNSCPLVVNTPNGGQKWKTGKKYAIKWVKGNAGATVKIQLLKSEKHHKWIAKKTKNDGNYIWKIPTTVNSGSAYTIKITSTSKKTVTDTSNKNFTITKTSGGSSSLSVTTPNGGQKWKTGKKYTIKWAKGNGGTKVKIQLLESGNHNHWISKNTSNDGKYTWTIPTTIKTGTTYKIKITSISNKTINDTSNKNFTITKGGSSDDDTGGGR